MQKRTLWAFGTREVVYAAIGAALYAVLSVATNVLQIPSAANVSIRPAVAIPMFFGIAFGPWVGFISGFVGNMISDMISGYGFWPWWDIGNGLMGLIPGLIYLQIKDFRSSGDLIKAEIMVVVGTAIGMFVAAVSEIWVSGVDFATTMATNFMPAFISNVINGLILVPILMIAYAAIRGRSGR
jgi:energy-coupling factor transport system substrate-specific component